MDGHCGCGYVGARVLTGNFASRVSLLFGIAGFLAFFGGEMFTTAKDAIVSYKRRKDWEKKINRK